MKCELVDPDGLLKQLRILKSVNVDGVAVDCWWGIVEAHAPQEYNWNGYKRLFQMVRELKLKLQVSLFGFIVFLVLIVANVAHGKYCSLYGHPDSHLFFPNV